jgi:hypothetical protein
MWGHLEFIMYEAPNWTAANQIDVYSQTVLHVTQRENQVSCSILSFIHYASDIAECVEKWATSARCIPNEIW